MAVCHDLNSLMGKVTDFSCDKDGNDDFQCKKQNHFFEVRLAYRKLYIFNVYNLIIQLGDKDTPMKLSPQLMP